MIISGTGWIAPKFTRNRTKATTKVIAKPITSKTGKYILLILDILIKT
jgi:hypothetical protein